MILLFLFLIIMKKKRKEKKMFTLYFFNFSILLYVNFIYSHKLNIYLYCKYRMIFTKQKNKTKIKLN